MIPFFGDRDSQDVFNILMSSGKSRPVSDFPILQYYLTEVGHHPHLKAYGDFSLNHSVFAKDIKPFIKKTYFTRENVVDSEDCIIPQMDGGIYSLGKGYILEVNVHSQAVSNFDVDIHNLLERITNGSELVRTSFVNLFTPGYESELYDPELEKQFFEIIKKNKIEANNTSSRIGMVCAEDGDYYMKTFYIKKDYSIKQGDLHYGKGFDVFHAKLVERLKNDSKGLVLLHGEPGGGKSFYIRSLIKDLIKIDKYVIYLQPSMIEQMTDPSMLNFISRTVMEKAEDGKSCILLLEDAEPLLTSRSEARSGGITNLLNMTDGILNDMLNLQVIATFNTKLSNIDTALLRPERLIARKEFKRLKKEDAQLLADYLKIDKKIEADSTLAEIYSQSKHSEVLIHEYDTNENKIGF